MLSDSLPVTVPVAITLTGSMLPCTVCGVAVDGPHLKRDVIENAITAAYDPKLGRIYNLPEPRMLTTTRCETCAGRLAEAQSILAEHPRLSVWLGATSLIVERLEAVLVTVALSGGSIRTTTDAEVMLALEKVNDPGGPAFWVRRFAPVLEPGARFGQANAAPFAHVDGNLRQAARDAMAALLRARTSHSVDPLGPPEDSARRGCLLCGVARADAWEAMTVSTRALGGRPTPASIEGDICGVCADVVQAVGSVGRTSMMRAVLAHLGVSRGFVTGSVELHMVGWGALTGATANREPWAHIDLAALRADLAAAGVA